jgi:hypothetical protein
MKPLGSHHGSLSLVYICDGGDDLTHCVMVQLGGDGLTLISL